MYLTEVAPVPLRGAAGTLNQFFITVGIFVSEVLGLEQIFGNEHLWSLLLGDYYTTMLFRSITLYILLHFQLLLSFRRLCSGLCYHFAPSLLDICLL